MDNLKLTPKNIGRVLGMTFITNQDTVTGLTVGYEINYGTMSLPMQIDIWDKLTATEKNHTQAIYNKLLNVANGMIANSQ